MPALTSSLRHGDARRPPVIGRLAQGAPGAGASVAGGADAATPPAGCVNSRIPIRIAAGVLVLAIAAVDVCRPRNALLHNYAAAALHSWHWPIWQHKL